MRAVVTFALFMIGVIQIGCWNSGPTPRDVYLTTCEQLSVPYNGDEVLRFLSNGDTITLKGNGVQWTKEAASEFDATFMKSVKNYHFSNDSFSLIIRLHPKLDSRSTSVKISKKVDSHWLAGMTIEYCDGYGLPVLEVGNKLYFNQPDDSIQILNKTYYKVYTVAPHFYYNLSDGILKFTDKGNGFNSGRVYERIP